MKTYDQLYAQEQRAQMRSHAMMFRQCVSPGNHYEKFTKRCERGAFYIGLAMEYRDRALRALQLEKEAAR